MRMSVTTTSGRSASTRRAASRGRRRQRRPRSPAVSRAAAGPLANEIVILGEHEPDRHGDEDTPVTTAPLVLIVDDNQKNLRLARDVLRAAGFRTLEADRGAAGLRLQPSTPARRDLDGSPVAGHGRCGRRRKLANGPRTSAIPVVALSALVLEGGVAWLLSNGFAGHLDKPIDVQEFPRQVRRFCSG